MKIAILTGKADASGVVPERSDQGGTCLLYHLDDVTLQATLVEEMSFSGSGLEAADKIIEADCEAVISGILNDKVFDKIAGAGITRFDGRQMDVETALHTMNQGIIEVFSHSEHEEVDHQHESHCDGCSGFRESTGLQGVYLTLEAQELIDQRHLEVDDVFSVVMRGEESGSKLFNQKKNCYVVHKKVGNITIWVEYLMEDGSAQILNAYSHRLEVVGDVIE